VTRAALTVGTGIKGCDFRTDPINKEVDSRVV